MTRKYPFLISVPHGGTDVPRDVLPMIRLTEQDLQYYSDPLTPVIYGYRNRVPAYIDTRISRMVVDVNRPPLPLPLRNPDGIIKLRTIDGTRVWRSGRVPDIRLVHRLLLDHYFPYHQKIDELIDRHHIIAAFDCHAMLPYGSLHQKDAGKERPKICLGNNGDRRGRAKKGSITTCSEEWIATLAGLFADEFGGNGAVAINNPFSAGFIANAHYWRKGVPWVLIEVNRSLYEADPRAAIPDRNDRKRAVALRERIWKVLTTFEGCIS